MNNDLQFHSWQLNLEKKYEAEMRKIVHNVVHKSIGIGL